ncbi:MAG: tRNA (N6-threonylcarbamoyladenosine(37)-N6)-methyltransferase TrmO [Halanaerobiales bacterium]|nr:tRNA (N6-threonylcarbamoyladenosine(37)-N6)-methyltransferase TrmO [Halanaerobiales bacterium]
MFQLKAVGIVKNDFKEPVKPAKIREKNSQIIIHEEFSEGLYKIEENDCLQVVFYLNKSNGFKLKGKRRGKELGVFACRSPHRPNSIAVTTVKLIRRDKNRLIVEGLDAIDKTPIIDIKPYVSQIDEC